MSLQPTFYPLEAERKGASPFQYGFVFAIPSLSLFIFSPVFGKYTTKLGVKSCLCFGSVLESLSGFLFVFLSYFQSANLFIFVSSVLRFSEGFGASMSRGSSLGILTTMFPNKVR